MGIFIFFSENTFIRAVCISALASLCFVFTISAQTADKPDLRVEDCINCKGNAQNFSILNAFFSDPSGTPIQDLCGATGPILISILYTSNQNKDAHNFRIIADILKKRRDTDEILEGYYLNEFSGTVPPCNTGTCIITIPIPALNFDCQNEYYELSNPMSFWTQASNKDLEDSYECRDYPTAQCSHSENIPIEIGDLTYNFDVNFECFQENTDHTNISFVITSLFGGNPVQPYEILWEFVFSDGTTETSPLINPTFSEIESGQAIEATLTIKQSPIVGDPEIKTITVPLALNEEDVIESYTVVNPEEDNNNGSIEVDFKPGNYTFFWTSVDDPDFYSEDAKIENLPDGTYVLTTYDDVTGLCRTDVFEIFSILPVELMYFNGELNSTQNTIELNWATAKEWESSHFEVMRSYDNLDNWQKIGEIEATGFSDKIVEYQYIDKDNHNFYSIAYYQLKQVDIDKTFDFSKVISVQFPEPFKKSSTWTVYPNPIDRKSANLILNEGKDYQGGTITAKLVNPLGGSTVFSGNNISLLSDQLQQALSQSSKGVYVLHLVWENKDQQIKILKH